MLDFMNQITDKPDWHKKVFDDAIVSNWKAEGIRWDDSLPEKGDWWLSEKMFEVCMLELQEKARMFEDKGFVAVLDAEATVVKSDVAVSADLKEALRREVRPLEDVPDQSKDWHPYSGDLVLDLVHPSLFPVVYGVTRALPTGTVPLNECVEYTGKGEIIPEFSATSHKISAGWGNAIDFEKAWGSFQWLPSDIKFASTAEDPIVIVSYINNLHPQKHAGLYRVLERFVDAAIPLWDECLSSFYSRIRIDVQGTSDEDYEFPEGITFPRNADPDDNSTDEEEQNEEGDDEDGENEEEENEDEENGDEENEVEENEVEENENEEIGDEEHEVKENKADKNEDEENEDDKSSYMSDETWAYEHDATDRYRRWQRKNRVLRQPEPTFVSYADLEPLPMYRPINLREKFAEQGLQVIFKLANIHLTPEDPSYDGGSWHIEGSLNEHICATALYYYDSENVTDSHLEFRQSYDEEAMVMKPA
jgi:hypothetical protein